MKEIPILMSTEMVQATLEGRKTMTRRIIKPQPVIDEHSGRVFDGHKPAKRSPFDIHNWKEPFADYFSRWKVGDFLWVREKRGLYQDRGTYVFRTDVTEHQAGFYKWKPSIHMPKDAARIWLEVKDVKVERLQDITEEDARAEGVADYESKTRIEMPGWWDYSGEEGCCVDAVVSFITLWQSINGEESWKQNPWVWVIQFKVLSTTGKPDQATSRKARKFERLIGFNGESGTSGNNY